MCFGLNCPLKEKCFRYTAIASEFIQSYFTKPPFEDGECEYFRKDNYENRKINRLVS